MKQFIMRWLAAYREGREIEQFGRRSVEIKNGSLLLDFS